MLQYIHAEEVERCEGETFVEPGINGQAYAYTRYTGNLSDEVLRWKSYTELTQAQLHLLTGVYIQLHLEALSLLLMRAR